MFGDNSISPADNADKQPLLRKPREQRADPPSVANAYYTQKSSLGSTRYYQDFQMKSLAMTARANRITTPREDARTISAMLDLAQARGWQSIKVSGSAAFKSEAWVQARARGLEVEGHKPTQPEKQELGKRQGPEQQAAGAATAPAQGAAQQAQASAFQRAEAVGKEKNTVSPRQAQSATESSSMAA